MKQPNDTKTVDIFAGEKRGRGRPKLDNAKSTAERSRLYRLNRKAREASQEHALDAASAAELHKLRVDCAILRGQVADLKAQGPQAPAPHDGFDYVLRSAYVALECKVAALEDEQRRLIDERGRAFNSNADLQALLDKRGASQEFPLEARQRISSLESKVKGLNQLLDEAEQKVNKYTRLADIAQEEVLQLKRAALPKLIVPGVKKPSSVKSDASQEITAVSAKKSSRKTVTKKDSLEEQFDYPD